MLASLTAWYILELAGMKLIDSKAVDVSISLTWDEGLLNEIAIF